MKREYYKNGKRHTAILEDGSFIEVKTLLTVTTITTGKNTYLTNDARSFDVASDAKTFFLAVEEALEKNVQIIDSLKSCRLCGCTDDNCKQCIEKTGFACHWVEHDLCSACVPNEQPVTCQICSESLSKCLCD